MAIYCVNFGVNFFFQKFCPCKKNDKYEVWRPSHIAMHCALHLGGGGCDCGVHGALYCSWLRFPLLIGLPLHLFGSSLGQMFYLQSFWGGTPFPNMWFWVLENYQEIIKLAIFITQMTFKPQSATLIKPTTNWRTPAGLVEITFYSKSRQTVLNSA